MKIIDIQQNTEEWFEKRKGKIGSSDLKNIISKRATTDKKIGFYRLIADRIAQPQGDISPMENGHLLEPEAAAYFSELYEKELIEVGMCLSDENPNIANSPDRYVKPGKDGKYTEAVEIKCLTAPYHLKAILEKQILAEHNYQKLQYFIVNDDLQKLYFVYYCPLVTAKPFEVYEINREDIQDEIEQVKAYELQVLKDVDEIVERLTF